MPDVKPSEKHDKKGLNHYLARCVPVVMKENGGNQKAALGKCYGMYRQSKKRKKAKGDLSEPNFETENETKVAFILPNNP